MSRNKPYGFAFGIFEFFVLICTSGFALFWIIPREIYRWTQPAKKKCCH